MGNICPFKRAVHSKMLESKPIEIILMGGSVTYGADLKDRMNQRWSNYFEKNLNSGWYDGVINVRNMGVGACNIDVWITRVRELSNADIIIVDLSVNDQGFDLQALPHLYQTYIQLVDNLPKHPAILFHYAFRTAKYDVKDQNHHCPSVTQQGSCCGGYVYCKKWWEMQDFVAIILKKFGIPFVSFRDLVWPDYLNPPVNLPEIWNGQSHPDYRAHKLFAKLISFGFLIQMKESMNDIHCNHESKDRYVNHHNRDNSLVPLCFEPLSHMRATDSIDSIQSFALSDKSYSIINENPFRNWNFYNDSKQKFGWILETNLDSVKSYCNKLSSVDSVARITSDQGVCNKAKEKMTLSLRIRLSHNPIIQIYYLKSYAEEMGSVSVWVDDGKGDVKEDQNQAVEVPRVDIDGWWDMPYSVTRVITIARNELLNISSTVKGEVRILDNLSAGSHDLHITLERFKNAKFKWKLLGVTTC